MNEKPTPKLSFEEAFERLESILELMNEGQVSLDDSLKLFVEADKLIDSCHGQLSSAEQKIEMLIKNRNGELSLDKEQKPKTEEFAPQSEQIFNTKS